MSAPVGCCRIGKQQGKWEVWRGEEAWPRRMGRAVGPKKGVAKSLGRTQAGGAGLTLEGRVIRME